MANWVAPLRKLTVTSKYNLNRKHPITGRISAHVGTDFRGATGTPTFAVAAGTVILSGFHSTAGHRIHIRLDGGEEVRYLHLSKRHVKVGDRVSKGQTIGAVGATGAVTGAHLHFEVRVGGKFIDPEPYIDRMTSITTNRPAPQGEIDVAKLPIVRRGGSQSREAVKRVQGLLHAAGYGSQTGAIDGIPGAKFDRGVESFQRANSLVADKIVGAKTWAKLLGL